MADQLNLMMQMQLQQMQHMQQHVNNQNGPPVEAKDKITAASIPLFKIPRARLAAAVEHVTGLDGGCATEVTQECLAVLLWIFCRIKPNVVTAELRSATYKDLNDTFKRASIRYKNSDEAAYNRALKRFQESPNIPNELVMEEAISQGFEPQFMEVKKKRGKRDIASTMSKLDEMFKKKKNRRASPAAFCAAIARLRQWRREFGSVGSRHLSRNGAPAAAAPGADAAADRAAD